MDNRLKETLISFLKQERANGKSEDFVVYELPKFLREEGVDPVTALQACKYLTDEIKNEVGFAYLSELSTADQLVFYDRLPRIIDRDGYKEVFYPMNMLHTEALFPDQYEAWKRRYQQYLGNI